MEHGGKVCKRYAGKGGAAVNNAKFGRLKEPRTRICSECGKEFVAYHSTQVACSPECQYTRKLRVSREIRNGYRERARKNPGSAADCTDLTSLRRAWGIAQPVPTDTIMRSHKKPHGVSDVRWRIELRRRAQREVYEFAMPASFFK